MAAVMRDWQGPARDVAASAFVLSAVIVPLDGGDASKSALPVARTLAQSQNATVHVVYVGEQIHGPRQTLQELGITPEDMRGAVLDHVSGTPAEAILLLSRQLPGSIVVMCTHSNESAEGESSLGAVPEAVLDAAPDRLVLVTPERGQAPWEIRRILLAHDGTPSADNAIGPTAELAQRAGAEVTALHIAARTAEEPNEPGSLPAPRYIDQPQHEWPAWANEFVTRMLAIGGSAAAIDFKLLVAGGQPGSEIAQFARDNHADLVVLPWHGNWQAQRAGAVDVVVRRSGCPVLLICTI